jgi:hypothetical protein
MVALLLALPARAQGRDPATAEALFEAARSAFEAGHYAEACAKFAESQRLDPGAGTLINLAACREKENKLSLAWEAWQEALRLLRSDDDRRPEVERRAKELDARLPRLVVVLAPDAPAGCEVTRDGAALGSAVLGVPIPVDPGKHVIAVTAPGRTPAQFEIDLAEGKTERLTVTPGAPAAKQAPIVKKPTAPPTAPSTPAPKRPEADRGHGSTGKTVGYAIGGLGALGVVLGGVTGVLALGKKHTMDDDCVAQNGTHYCGQAGIAAANSGKTLATVSTVSFIAGGVAVGVGAYLVLSSGGESTTTISTQALPGGGSLGIARTF